MAAPNRRRVDFPNKNEIPNLKELGVSGSRILSGLVFEEELPQLQGLNAYRVFNRIRLDPTGAALLKSVEFPVRSARWFIEPFSDNPKDVERADFCLPGDQIVLDGTGAPRRIDQIRPGDQVLSGKGRSRTVLRVSRRPFDGHLVSLSVQGYPHRLRLTPEHRVPTSAGWRQAGELEIGDELGRPRPSFVEGGNYEDGWLVGLYLAEGSCDRRRTTVEFSCHEREAAAVTARLMVWLERAGNTRPYGPPIRPHLIRRQGKGCGVTVSHRGLRDLIEEWAWSAPGRQEGARTKRLRKFPVEQNFAQGIWDGWMAGDGSRWQSHRGDHVFNNASGVTASPWLAHQLQLIAGSLGLPAPLRFKRGGQEITINGVKSIASDAYSINAAPVYRKVGKRTPALVGQAFSLRAEGASYAQTAAATAVSTMAVWHWLNDPSRSTQTTKQCRVEPDRIIHKVQVIEREHYQGPVYDLTVEEDHTFCAGPVAVSNCHDMVYNYGSQSMDDIIRLAYTNKPFGFAAMEIVYELIDGGRWDKKIGWEKMAWRHPLSKWRWNMGEVSGRQELVSMTQLAPPYYEQVDIPRNKLMLFVYNRLGDNFDGESLFRPAYKNWVFRDNLYRIQAVGLERAYAGLPVVELPPSFSDEMVALAKQIVTTVRTDEQSGVVIPNDMAFRIEHWALEGTAMQGAIDHHDAQILASGLAHFLKLGSKGGGSLALSQDQSELFLDALNGDANQFAETFNLDPGIPTLIRVNYKDADDMEMPRLQHGDIGERSLEKLGRTLMALGQWGFLTPDDATEDKLREMLDLPQREYDFEDRDLWDIITKAQPDFPNWRVGPRQFPARLRPGTLVPDPTDPRSSALLAQQQQQAGPRDAFGKDPTPSKAGTQAPVRGKQKPAKGGGKPDTGGPGDFSERMMDFSETYDRYMNEQEKLADIVQANRWKRPQGRPTEETRIRTRLTEKFAEALDDIAPGRSRRSAPERPSIVIAKNRRPYVVRSIQAAEPESPQAKARRFTPSGPRQKALERHTEPLKRLLIPAKLRKAADDPAQV